MAHDSRIGHGIALLTGDTAAVAPHQAWSRCLGLALLLVAPLLLTACAGGGQTPAPTRDATIVAVRTAEPVTIDGRLDDAVWQRAPRYHLQKGVDRLEDRPGVEVVPGYVQFAWDDDHLYLAATFTDHDVHAWSDEDQKHHYNLGDVCELFLKPVGSTWYWELYVTPRGNKTLFWFPGPGLLRQPANFEADPAPLRVGAQVQGTLNDWSDVDEGWTAEMAVPVDMLTEHGDAFGPGHDWLVLVGRYNHSRYHDYTGPQLTMYPQLPRSRFHDWMNYARLVLEE